MKIGMAAIDDPTAERRNPCPIGDQLFERRRHEALVAFHSKHAFRRGEPEFMRSLVSSGQVWVFLARARRNAGVRCCEQTLVLRIWNDLEREIKAEGMDQRFSRHLRRPEPVARARRSRQLRGHAPRWRGADPEPGAAVQEPQPDLLFQGHQRSLAWRFSRSGSRSLRGQGPGDALSRLRALGCGGREQAWDPDQCDRANHPQQSNNCAS